MNNCIHQCEWKEFQYLYIYLSITICVPTRSTSRCITHYEYQTNELYVSPLLTMWRLWNVYQFSQRLQVWWDKTKRSQNYLVFQIHPVKVLHWQCRVNDLLLLESVMKDWKTIFKDSFYIHIASVKIQIPKTPPILLTNYQLSGPGQLANQSLPSYPGFCLRLPGPTSPGTASGGSLFKVMFDWFPALLQGTCWELDLWLTTIIFRLSLD